MERHRGRTQRETILNTRDNANKLREQERINDVAAGTLQQNQTAMYLQVLTQTKLPWSRIVSDPRSGSRNCSAGPVLEENGEMCLWQRRMNHFWGSGGGRLGPRPLEPQDSLLDPVMSPVCLHLECSEQVQFVYRLKFRHNSSNSKTTTTSAQQLPSDQNHATSLRGDCPLDGNRKLGQPEVVAFAAFQAQCEL